MANRFAAEVLQILTIGDETMNQAQRTFGGLHRNGVNQIVEHAFSDDSEQFADLRIRDRVAAISDSLFEKRKAIAKTSFGGTRKHSDRTGINLQIFGFGNALDFAGNFLKGQCAELKKLRARLDC